MRILTIAIVAPRFPGRCQPPRLLQACRQQAMHSAKAATADYSAAKKKSKKQKKEKEEYMRAAPMK